MKNEQWFLDRISQRVWSNKTSCKCDICNRVYENGIVISDQLHANYLCNVYADYNAEGMPLDYFDTKQERDEFEKQLSL